MSEERIRFALVGCGRISQIHLAALQSRPRAELVAVADVNVVAASDVAEAWGGKPFDDVGEMLQKMRPEAVILCTPPSTHRELAVSCMEAGAHVMCEKPLAVTVRDAIAMEEVSVRTGRLLMMASKFRYVEDMIKARAILKSGNLGVVLSFENEFCSYVDMAHRWNSSRDVAGGGVLIDNGTHSADIVRYLLGSVVGVQAIGDKRWQPLEVEDGCRMFCRVEEGTIASIHLSWSVQKHTPWYVSIFGTEGVLQVGWHQSRYRHGGTDGWMGFGSGYDKPQAVGHQLDNFIDTIRGEAAPLSGVDSALASVRVIQAAYRSLDKGVWEHVEP